MLIRVKVGDGLHQADAPHLEQVVRAFAPLVEAADDAEHQPQIALNQFLPGFFVSGLCQSEQSVHFRMGKGL